MDKYYGVKCDQLNSTDSCGKHGTCVNALCVCDSGWTGAGDIYTYEGVDCHTPIILIRLAWVLALIAVLRCMENHRKVLKHQLVLFKRRKTSHKKSGITFRVTQYFPLMVVLFSCCVEMPAIFSSIVYKLINPDIGFGIHLDYTIMILIGLNGYNIMGGRVSANNLSVFIKKLEHRRTEKLRRLFATHKFINYLYLCISTSLTIYGTTIEGHSRYRLIVLLGRNVGLCLYMIMLVVMANFTKYEARALKESMKSIGSVDKQGVVNEFCARMDGYAKAIRSICVTIILLYTLFSIPPVWPYLTFTTVYSLVMSYQPKKHYVNLFSESASSAVVNPTTQSTNQKSQTGLSKVNETMYTEELETI